MYHQRIFYGLGALTVAFGFLTAAPAAILSPEYTNQTMQAGAPRQPSIILIRCHGLGSGDLSCYGQTNFQTPNLDKLAAGGLRFTHFTAGEPDFSSALSAIMTGKNGAFGPGSDTLVKRLKSAGYHTGLIGEWTLGDQPWTQGFDEYIGFINDDEGRRYYADYVWRFAPHSLFDPDTHTVKDYAGKEMIFANSGAQKNKYMPEVFANSILEFIKANNPDHFNEHRPFFLLVDFSAPRSATKNADDFPVPSDAPYTDEPWPQAAKNRVALITRVDGSIGRLFEQLNKYGITNNYVIIFSSSAAPEKFTDRKLDFLTPNGQRPPGADPATVPLPMIVYGPGQVVAGQVSDKAWKSVDVMPTLLEIAHLKPGKSIAGKSILPVLQGEK